MARRAGIVVLVSVLWLGGTARAVEGYVGKAGMDEVLNVLRASFRRFGVPAAELNMKAAEAFTSIINAWSRHHVTVLNDVAAPATGQMLDADARELIYRKAIDNSPKFRAYVIRRIGQLTNFVLRHPNALQLFEQLLTHARVWRQIVVKAAGRVLAPAVRRLVARFLIEETGSISLGVLLRGVGLLLTLDLVRITATESYKVGHEFSVARLKERDLKARVASEAKFTRLAQEITKSLRARRTRLLPGVTPERAIGLLERNLQARQAPFADIFEARDCPDLSGAWTGQLSITKIEGRSNLREGQRRKITGRQFVIEQDHNKVTLQISGQQAVGAFDAPEYLKGTGDRPGTKALTVREHVFLYAKPPGNVESVELWYFTGAVSPAHAGELLVSIKQKSSRGAVIHTSGTLRKKP